MHTQQRSAIDELSFEIERSKIFNEMLRRHPYPVDDTKNRYEQWENFVLHDIEHTAIHHPDILGWRVADAIRYCSNAYSRHKKWFNMSDHGDELKTVQQQLLTTILERLQTLSPAPIWSAAKAYHQSLDQWTQRNGKKINHLWTILDRYGLRIDPNDKGFHHLWEEIIQNGHTAEAQRLIEQGLLPTWRGADRRWANVGTNSDQDTILHLVHNKQTFEVLRMLPDHHLKPLVTMVHKNGDTPLHHAARNLMPEFVQLLLRLGADPTQVNAKGQYPADVIRRTKSRADAVGQVLELLGKRSSKKPEDLFLQACKTKDVTMAQMAKDKGADLVTLCQSGQPALLLFDLLSSSGMKQARKRQAEFLQFLLDSGVNCQRPGGNDLHLAINTGAVACVDVLLTHNPLLAQDTNAHGQRPAQMPTNQVEVETPSTMYVDPAQHQVLLAKTQMAMFKLFMKHNIDIQEGDFPNLCKDPEYHAQMTKMLLKRELGEAGVVARPRKKM